MHILLLEDSPLDAELTLAALDEAGVPHAATRVDTAEAFAAGLDAGPDLILSDYVLPSYDGIAALRVAHERRPDVPFIFVSGALGEELAIESLKDGATDYVLKQRLGRLGPAVRRAMAEAADRRARRQGEDRYRFLADAVPQVVWTARPDGTVDHTNARWHEFTGLTAEQTRAGGGIAAAVPPDDLPAAAAAWAAAVASGRPFEAEHRLRGRDGSDRWHLVRAVPRLDADGRVAQWVGTAVDIDDRRRAESEHRRTLEQLDAILSHMSEGLAVADGTGHLLSVNAAGLRIHGIDDLAELPGRVQDLPRRIEFATLDDHPLPADRWPLARVMAGETFTEYQVRVHRPANGRRWVGSYAGVPIRNVRGEIEMAVVTFRDVTAQARAEAELAQAKRDADQARDAAEAANRSKDDFLATLSHELRTPLNAILGWTQLLRGDLGDGTGRIEPDDLRQGLATIDRNARSQAQLIEDLLDVSRIVSGNLRLSRGPADLGAILAAAVDVVRPAADGRKVHLSVAAGPAQLPLVCDADRIQQVAWNLLANAVKFTPAGGRVTATTGPADGGVELVVTDTGQGIRPDFLPHVFDRFRQADGTASRQHGGLGLGLAIVRHLVGQHGGRVTAASDGDGRGSTFRVWLPGGEPEAATAGVPADAVPLTGVSLAGTAVLVVDDEPDARSVLAALLRREGAVVTAVASAAEAVAAVVNTRPAVVVSDIGMPGQDGFGLIAAIRQLPADVGGRTPAVALTAYARTDDRDRALAAGFDAHLAKPLDAAALLSTVSTLAQRPD